MTRHLMLAMLALLPVAAGSLSAQRPTARSSVVIRAEYAAVLLQSGRYIEAAQEYRTLLASSPRQPEYRLGLAQALAWGGRPREAERELRTLSAQQPSDPTVTALLRTTRMSYDPTAQEALDWVTEAPTFAPYRLALARALVREGAPRVSLLHYDLLLVLGRPIESRPVTSPAVLLRESAEARMAAGDRSEAERVLREALARAPADTIIRHGLALVLAGVGAADQALAQYDTLLAPRSWSVDTTFVLVAATTPDDRATRASLLLERAQVNVTRGDLSAADVDANASLTERPSVEALLLLGDLSRWRGQYAAARASYERARVMQPESAAVTAAFGRLARDEHPALAFAPVETPEEGWSAEGSAIGDNLGVRYFTVGARRGVTLPAGVAASAGVEVRELTSRGPLGIVALPGYAAELALAREGQLGALYARVGGRGGLVGHPGLGEYPEGSLSVAGWYGAWGVGLDGRSELAYPALLTMGSLSPSRADLPAGVISPVDQPLRARTVTASIAGPLARVDLALVGQRSQLSDGNVRSTVQLFARVPLAPRLALIYAGSGMQYATRSALYWDPVSYVSSATGLEYAMRRARGLSVALQAMPGIARSTELPLATPGIELRRTAAQVTGTGDASYRTEAWDAGAALSYSRGRAGDYQQLGASVRLRVHP